MDTLQKLIEISSRIEHLENSAEWIAKETIHSDNALSQTSTLMLVLADELREKVYSLVHELELNIKSQSSCFIEEDINFH